MLEDGTVFPGRAVGASGVAAGEACFSTASAGYEQAVTDPSYARQVLTFAYPLIGNYGVDERLLESDRVWTEGVVMRRSRPAWSSWLASRGVVALEEVDTRALVRRLREDGASGAHSARRSPEELHARALAQPHLDWPRMQEEPELASPPPALEACTPEPYSVGAGPRVVVLDLGCKRSIVRRLVETGVEAYVVPGTWTADAVLELEPTAVLIGNGPGDPAQLDGPIETVRGLLGRVPLFGICLGHQLVALALGLDTFKLKFGHRGANHPVREREQPRARHGAEPRLRRRAGRRRRDQPRLAERRHRGGPRRRRLRDTPVPPGGRARAARRRALLRPDRRRVPKRTDLRSVLIVGSGPIRIGQGCEFDYAGVQACRVLRGEGYRVVLANSNPATIMTDPEWADATYLEPLDAETLAEIIAAERPDALLPRSAARPRSTSPWSSPRRACSRSTASS